MKPDHNWIYYNNPGILKKSEDCKYKISSNSQVKLHYRARAWGEDEFFENTYIAPEGAHTFKLGKFLYDREKEKNFVIDDS